MQVSKGRGGVQLCAAQRFLQGAHGQCTGSARSGVVIEHEVMCTEVLFVPRAGSGKVFLYTERRTDLRGKEIWTTYTSRMGLSLSTSIIESAT